MAKAKKERSLTPKQEKFVAEYVKNGGNAKQAAIKAYPDQNENSAAQQGWHHVSGSNEPLLAKTHRNEDCIFEQYTGLKDKNGQKNI